jgi:hypothetical protein
MRDFNSLIVALSPFYDSLRTLNFLNHYSWDVEISPLHSLTLFSKLERFSSDAAILTGSGTQYFVRKLPKSLNKIQLNDHMSWILDDLGRDGVRDVFAEAKLMFLPNLTNVDLVLDEDDDCGDSIQFERNGVNICVRTESLF